MVWSSDRLCLFFCSKVGGIHLVTWSLGGSLRNSCRSSMTGSWGKKNMNKHTKLTEYEFMIIHVILPSTQILFFALEPVVGYCRCCRSAYFQCSNYLGGWSGATSEPTNKIHANPTSRSLFVTWQRLEVLGSRRLMTSRHLDLGASHLGALHGVGVASPLLPELLEPGLVIPASLLWFKFIRDKQHEKIENYEKPKDAGS